MTHPAGPANFCSMWSYHPELLAAPVPRYTSFPTAAEFGSDVGPDDFADAIEAVSGDVSLYLHVPFCEKICWYCGCNTSAANRSTRVDAYVEALHREIALVARHMPRTARVRSIAFGGGSPNALTPVQFVRLIDALTVSFAAVAPEMSIELDPRAFTESWAKVIGAVGIRRASLGVQTFEPELQQAIGRVQPTAAIEQAVAMLRRARVQSLNFDLMYGLPGQTIAHLEHSLDETVRLGADRVALFGYAHVPHLIARQAKIDASALPDARARFEMAARGHDRLVAAGYVPVGFDHFALPGDPLAQAATAGRLHRNFQGFTDDPSTALIGLGASAISSFPELIVQNEKNTGRYRTLIGKGRFSAVRGVRRSEQDRRRASVIESLLCHGHARIDPDLQSEAAERLQPHLASHLCEIVADDLRLCDEALPYARTIAACFDPYRQDSLRRFSSAI